MAVSLQCVDIPDCSLWLWYLPYVPSSWDTTTTVCLIPTAVAPFTGVMLADYLVVRRCVIKLEDCYIGNSTSLYWYDPCSTIHLHGRLRKPSRYWHGFHWRALVAWAIGVFPTMPGLIMTVQDPEAYNGWVRTFHITFFIGEIRSVY